MRQAGLDRIQHLLRHLLRLRHQNHPDVRVHSDPIHHVVDSDAGGLRMLGRHVHHDQIPLTGLERHPRMQPRRVTALNQIHHVLHMRKHPSPQEPLRELTEPQMLPNTLHIPRRAQIPDTRHRIHKLQVRAAPLLIRRPGPVRRPQRLTHRHTLRKSRQKPLLRLRLRQVVLTPMTARRTTSHNASRGERKTMSRSPDTGGWRG